MASSYRDRKISAEEVRYRERTEGLLRLVCRVCGKVFYAEKERTTCSLECSRK